MYFLLKKKENKEEEKNDQQRQTTYQLPSHVTPGEKGHGGTSKDMAEGKVWTSGGIERVVQRPRMPPTRWHIKKTR